MAKEENYYEILGVSRTATSEEITKAYRKKMKEHHPDLHNSEEDEETSKLLNEAYEVLSDKEKRKEYDEALESGFEEPNECDNPEEFFTEDELQYNRIMNLRILIEQELAKTEEVIEYKNEVLSICLNELDKSEYFGNIKEVVHTMSDFIKSLENFLEQAIKYEQNDYVELLKETIQFLEEEMKDIPLSKSELKRKIERQRQKNSLFQEVENELDNFRSLLDNIKSLLSFCYERQIDRLEYGNYRTSISLKAKSSIGKLSGLAVTLKRVKENKKYNEVLEAISLLNNSINLLPKDYEDARRLGHAEQINDEMRESLKLWEKRKEVIDRLSELFEKYPSSKLIDRLLDFCLKSYDEAREVFENLAKESDKISEEASYKSRVDAAQKYSLDASQIYEEACKVHKNAAGVFKRAVKFNPTNMPDTEVLTLSQSALAGYNKGLALELLVKADSIIKTINKGEILSEEFRTLQQQIHEFLDSYDDDKEELRERTYALQENANPYCKFTESDFISKLRKLKLKIASNVLFLTIFVGGGLNSFKTAIVYPEFKMLPLYFLLLTSFLSFGGSFKELVDILPIYRELDEVSSFYKRFKSGH